MNHIFASIDYYEMTITYGIFMVVLLVREIENLKEFIYFTGILNFFEIIPQAMCILDKQLNQLIYTNSQFESLALKLTNEESKDKNFF